MSRGAAVARVLIALLCFTAGGIVARGVDGSPLAATGVRLAFAGPVLLAIARGRSRDDAPAIPIKDLVAPGIAFGVASVASQASFQWTSLANATLIPAAAPLVLLVAEFATGRRRWTARDVGTALAVGLALALFVSTGAQVGSQAWSGDVAALAFLGAWTTYLFLMRGRRGEGFGALALTGSVMSVAAVPVLIAAVATAGITTLSASDLVRCVIIAILSTIIGQTLVTSSLGTVEASTVGLVLLLQPVLSAFAASILFSEPLGGAVRWFSAGLVLLLLAATQLAGATRQVGAGERAAQSPPGPTDRERVRSRRRRGRTAT